LASACSLLDLVGGFRVGSLICPTGPRGLPVRSAAPSPPRGRLEPATLLTFGSPPEPSLRARTVDARERIAIFLSWGSRPSSASRRLPDGLHPSVDHLRTRTARAACARRAPTSIDGAAHVHSWSCLLRSESATSRIPFRPRGFSPPRRLPPCAGCECCHPLPTLGFTAFRPPTAREPSRIPAVRTTPRRTFPHTSTTTVTRGDCPPAVWFLQLLQLDVRPFPATRSAGHRRSHLDSEALLRCEVGVRPSTVAGCRGPVLPGLLITLDHTRVRRRRLGRQRTLRGALPSV
jgi:hypothetical protein